MPGRDEGLRESGRKTKLTKGRILIHPSNIHNNLLMLSVHTRALMQTPSYGMSSASLVLGEAESARQVFGT